MVDVVGLRFVSEGGEKAVQDLNKYKNAQNDLASATQKNITFSQRNAAQLQSVAQAYASGAITLREAGNLTEDLAQRTTALARAAGATDAQLVSLVRRFHEMADAALSAARAQEAAADYERRISAQMAFNEQLGVAGQRATEMGASFSQLATVLDNLDASARQFTSDLNDRLGVTGQRAVETGASFSQFATVLDNLDASARRFTSDLNDRLGVTGQRAVETGASFSQFATILDNLDAAARRFTSDLNARLGVTGQRAVETGASFSQFATILDNLDAAARQFTTDLNQRLGVTGQRATQAGASFSQFAAVLDNIEASARRFTSELNDRLGVTGQRAIQSGAGYEALEADIRSAETALKNFQASFDPTAAAARRLENAQTVLANAVRTGAITQEESNRIMQQYRGALDDTAKANELLRRETQALAIAYNPVMAAQIAYERKQQELNRAHELGVLSADKLQAELTQLAAAYNAIGGSTLNAQRFTNQFGENVRLAGIKTNRFGMVAQQVGYQVGDFFVQIQSGTNAFVAFGQQATQLAGLLPGVAGAVVGISIAVGTMLLGAWDRARKAQDEAAASIKNLNEELQSLDRTVQDWINTKKAAEAGVTVEELLGIKGLKQAQREFAEAQQNFARLIEQAREEIATSGLSGAVDPEEYARQYYGRQYRAAEAAVREGEQLLRDIQFQQRQQAREEAEAALNESWERQKREQALAEYEAGQAAIREREAWVEEAIGIFRDAQERMRNEEIARTEEALARLFRNRTVMYSIRFADEETVMSQPVLRTPAPPAPPSYEEAVRLGLTREQMDILKVDIPRGGGGGGAAREQDDYLKNLLLEAEQKRRLVGLTEEETRRQEILFELKKRELPLNDARIEQIIQTEAETRKLMEAEQRRQQLMQTVEGHIENAFMSWVDGSQSVEDAFRSMLRNIILAIYQQQVAEPAARAVGGLLSKAIPALFSANGNVFSGGAHVTAYANGGVVSAPTMFGHSGGLGVMGEAGPEAIMPLKRGANGKLGVQMEGAGAMTVHVVMDPSTAALGAYVTNEAGKIVARAAPNIIKGAQASVVDAKRRGGTYGRSF